MRLMAPAENYESAIYTFSFSLKELLDSNERIYLTFQLILKYFLNLA